MADNEYLYEKARKVIHLYTECKELQNIIAVKTVISVALTVFWYAVWISSAISYFGKPWATFNPKNVLMYISAFAILIAPFYIFKPQKWLKIHPYVGKITSVSAKNIRIDRASSMYHLYLKTVPFKGGQTTTIKLKLLPGISSYYQVDHYFVKLRGVQYPVRIDMTENEKSSDQAICHCCGRFNPKRYDRCFECSSLMWIKDI